MVLINATPSQPGVLQPLAEDRQRLLLEATVADRGQLVERYQSKAMPIDMPNPSRAFMPEE